MELELGALYTLHTAYTVTVIFSDQNEKKAARPTWISFSGQKKAFSVIGPLLWNSPLLFCIAEIHYF